MVTAGYTHLSTFVLLIIIIIIKFIFMSKKSTEYSIGQTIKITIRYDTGMDGEMNK